MTTKSIPLLQLEHTLFNKIDLNIATAQKMKLSIKDFFSKCDQIHRKLRTGELHFLCSRLSAGLALKEKMVVSLVYFDGRLLVARHQYLIT